MKRCLVWGCRSRCQRCTWSFLDVRLLRRFHALAAWVDGVDSSIEGDGGEEMAQPAARRRRRCLPTDAWRDLTASGPSELGNARAARPPICESSRQVGPSPGSHSTLGEPFLKKKKKPGCPPPQPAKTRHFASGPTVQVVRIVQLSIWRAARPESHHHTQMWQAGTNPLPTRASRLALPSHPHLRHAVAPINARCVYLEP